MSEYCREVVWAPGGAFSPEPDTALVLDGTDEIDGEVPNDGHVSCAVASSQARLVVTEGDIQYPMQAVLDGPMAAHGVGRVGRWKRGGRDVVTGLEAATVLEFGARSDANDCCDIRQSKLSREAPITLEPADLMGDGDGSLLDTAMALVHIHDG